MLNGGLVILSKNQVEGLHNRILFQRRSLQSDHLTLFLSQTALAK